MKLAPVITFDGPSGTGKGTISQLIAKELNWHYLDSGAIYRVLALAAKQYHLDFTDELSLAELAFKLDVKFEVNEKAVFLENNDVTQTIRTESCGNDASRISVYPEVRKALLERQRAFRQFPGLVTDGRDMGTVIFPDANLKFFLVASAEERAKRRYLQLKEKGISVSLGALYQELEERDQRDIQRDVSPLKPAIDAIHIDTTLSSIVEVMQIVRERVRAFLVDV